jgi:hypothetical protein
MVSDSSILIRYSALMIRGVALDHFFAHQSLLREAGVPPTLDEEAAPAWAVDIVPLSILPNESPGRVGAFLVDSHRSPRCPDDALIMPSRDRAIELTADEIRLLGSDDQAEQVGPPEHGDRLDIAAWEGRRRRALTRRVRRTWRLAWYGPFSALEGQAAGRAIIDDLSAKPPTWGIKLTTGGIDIVAWDFVERGMDAGIARSLAATYLLAHEYGHFLVDVALAEDERATSGLSETRVFLKTAKAHIASCGQCRREEAWCEAYALTQVRIAAESLGVAHDAVVEIVREFVADGLPGYKDGAEIEDVPATFRELLKHAGAADPGRAALLADLASTFHGLDEVAVALVRSPGSTFESGEWMCSF